MLSETRVELLTLPALCPEIQYTVAWVLHGLDLIIRQLFPALARLWSGWTCASFLLLLLLLGERRAAAGEWQTTDKSV